MGKWSIQRFLRFRALLRKSLPRPLRCSPTTIRANTRCFFEIRVVGWRGVALTNSPRMSWIAFVIDDTELGVPRQTTKRLGDQDWADWASRALIQGPIY